MKGNGYSPSFVPPIKGGIISVQVVAKDDLIDRFRIADCGLNNINSKIRNLKSRIIQTFIAIVSWLYT